MKNLIVWIATFANIQKIYFSFPQKNLNLPLSEKHFCGSLHEIFHQPVRWYGSYFLALGERVKQHEVQHNLSSEETLSETTHHLPINQHYDKHPLQERQAVPRSVCQTERSTAIHFHSSSPPLLSHNNTLHK